MKVFDVVAWILLVVGGLNWGLVALNYNLVEMLFGAGTGLTQIVYALVGVSAIYALFRKMSGGCSSSCKM